MSKLVIRQYKSAIGEKHAARQTLEALGLRRPGNVVEREDSASLRGQLRKIAHLVHIDTSEAKAAPAEQPSEKRTEQVIKS